MTVEQSKSDFIIRNLRYEDIPELVSLPRSEGREMGQESEIRTWMNVDPSGIFVAEMAEDGQLAGCCAGIALSDAHGYIGMFVVKPNYRGCGLGRVLWNAAINRLGERNMSLSTGPAMLPFYKGKAGFSLAATWTVDLYTSTNPQLPDCVFSRPQPLAFVVDPEGPLINHILQYDLMIHMYDRSAIVKETINEPGTITVVAVEASLERLSILGYACMKKSLQGHWLIAPMYAERFAAARSLIHGLFCALTPEELSEGVVAKLVSSNSEAAKLFSQVGLKRTEYRLQRLFTKEVFEIPENKVFALQTSVFCTE